MANEPNPALPARTVTITEDELAERYPNMPPVPKDRSDPRPIAKKIYHE